MIPIEILFEADEFKDAMKDAREQGKELAAKVSAEKAKELESKLSKDLKSKGLIVSELSLSLGKFKGFHYVSSCKITTKIKSQEFVDKLLNYLKDTYSPKFKLKSYDEETNEAHFNLR